MTKNHVPVGWALVEVTKLPNKYRTEAEILHETWRPLSRITAKRVWIGFGEGAKMFSRETGRPVARQHPVLRYRDRIVRIVKGEMHP